VGRRDSTSETLVINVVDSKDQSTTDSNFADTPAQVTRVFWCAPGLPRREILRTSLLAERRLAVRVYGFHMESRQVDGAPSNVQQWSAPVSACVLCTLAKYGFSWKSMNVSVACSVNCNSFSTLRRKKNTRFTEEVGMTNLRAQARASKTHQAGFA
jgi:hypothetical protein